MCGFNSVWKCPPPYDVGVDVGVEVVVGVLVFFFFQAEDGIRDLTVTGVQTCALPISRRVGRPVGERGEPLEVGDESPRSIHIRPLPSGPQEHGEPAVSKAPVSGKTRPPLAAPAQRIRLAVEIVFRLYYTSSDLDRQADALRWRSEEHTSELQSQSNLG